MSCNPDVPMLYFQRSTQFVIDIHRDKNVASFGFKVNSFEPKQPEPHPFYHELVFLFSCRSCKFIDQDEKPERLLKAFGEDKTSRYVCPFRVSKKSFFNTLTFKIFIYLFICLLIFSTDDSDSTSESEFLDPKSAKTKKKLRSRRKFILQEQRKVC